MTRAVKKLVFLQPLIKQLSKGVFEINNLDPKVSQRLRNKLNGLLTERQKKEIFDKVKDIDKAELQRMLEASRISNMSENELMSIIENAGKSDIINKLKRL